MDSMKNTNSIIAGLDDGDVIGFSGSSLVSDGINLATYGMPRWGLSHIGIISRNCFRKYLFESTTLGDTPCDITGEVVNGVQAHTLDNILERPGKVWKYPLATRLNSFERKVLQLNLLSHLGTPYDYKGAARSGGFLIRIVEQTFRRQDLSQFFCSELVALMFTKLELIDINNASGQSPNSLARRIVREGVCRKPIRIK